MTSTLRVHDDDHAAAPKCWLAMLSALPDILAFCAAHGWDVGPLGEHDIPDKLNCVTVRDHRSEQRHRRVVRRAGASRRPDRMDRPGEAIRLKVEPSRVGFQRPFILGVAGSGR